SDWRKSCWTRHPDGLVTAPGSSGADACRGSWGGRFPRELPVGHSMPQRFDARLDILPAAQREIWPNLSPAPGLSFVLYGGTAIALFLGHRQSVDFDFFR